jgi:flagellar motor switch protein FliN
MSENAEAVAVRTNAMLRELNLVHDIPMRIGIEVGRIRLRVRDLVKLTVGAVVEVKRPAGEPFDICVNGVGVARGEVIVVEQSSGVRIVEIHKPGGLVE